MEKQRIREEKKSQGIAVDSESDEDNPFAMYKYKEEQKCENNLENGDINLTMDTPESSTNESSSKKEPDEKIKEDDLDISKYIDPKPSTSKSNDTFVDIVNPKERKPVVKVIRKKSVIKNSSGRKHKKKQKTVEDNTIKNSDNSNIEMSPLTSNNVPEDSDTRIEIDNMENIAQTTSNSTNNIEITVDSDKQINTDEVEVKISDNPMNNSMEKQHKKLLKREAKMKEISERLKSVAEEYIKANINQ